mgnify:CR=1 FL=1
MKETNQERSNGRIKPEQFATGIGVLMATLGSAVGLGNIWKFPYLTGANGGAAFLIVYLLCTLLVGYPIMIAEQMIGRKGRGDAVTSFENLAPKKNMVAGGRLRCVGRLFDHGFLYRGGRVGFCLCGQSIST